MARILIVEDEPSIALALEEDLRREGYETELAADGGTAARRATDDARSMLERRWKPTVALEGGRFT